MDYSNFAKKIIDHNFEDKNCRDWLLDNVATQKVQTFIDDKSELLDIYHRNKPVTPFPSGSNKIEETLALIRKEMIIQKRKRLDVWTKSKRSKDEQSEFKENLIKYYDRSDSQNLFNIYCMVINRSYPRNKVKAAHIWKYATCGEGLDEFGLDPEMVSSERNGILVAEAIEEAFDDKQVCFIYNPLQQNLKFVVLDPSLREKLVSPSTSLKFKDIDGNVLQLPKDKFPFRRILSWHAKCAFKAAKTRKWIDEEKFKLYEDFSFLSEGASIPEYD